MRLTRLDELRSDDLEPLDPVRFGAVGERFNQHDLLVVGGDDEFAAAVVRHPLSRAERVERAHPSTQVWAFKEPSG